MVDEVEGVRRGQKRLPMGETGRREIDDDHPGSGTTRELATQRGHSDVGRDDDDKTLAYMQKSDPKHPVQGVTDLAKYDNDVTQKELAGQINKMSLMAQANDSRKSPVILTDTAGYETDLIAEKDIKDELLKSYQYTHEADNDEADDHEDGDTDDDGAAFKEDKSKKAIAYDQMHGAEGTTQENDGEDDDDGGDDGIGEKVEPDPALVDDQIIEPEVIGEEDDGNDDKDDDGENVEKVLVDTNPEPPINNEHLNAPELNPDDSTIEKVEPAPIVEPAPVVEPTFNNDTAQAATTDPEINGETADPNRKVDTSLKENNHITAEETEDIEENSNDEADGVEPEEDTGDKQDGDIDQKPIGKNIAENQFVRELEQADEISPGNNRT